MNKPNKDNTSPTAPDRGTAKGRKQRLTGPMRCPFCGCKPKVVSEHWNDWGNVGMTWVVECVSVRCIANPRTYPRCHKTGDTYTKEKAIERWNQREKVMPEAIIRALKKAAHYVKITENEASRREGADPFDRDAIPLEIQLEDAISWAGGTNQKTTYE